LNSRQKLSKEKRLKKMIKKEEVKNILAEVKEMLSPCVLCERQCGVDRIKGEKGYCNLGTDSFVFKDFIRVGEEANLSPSHAIYFSGCNMRCLSCSNGEYNKNPALDAHLDCRKLAKRIDDCSTQTKNVNFIGGEPTVNLYRLQEI